MNFYSFDVKYSILFFQILKGTCVRCHRLTCDSNSLPAKLLLAQLRAIELGMASIVEDLGVFIRNRFLDSGPFLFYLTKLLDPFFFNSLVLLLYLYY